MKFSPFFLSLFFSFLSISILFIGLLFAQTTGEIVESYNEYVSEDNSLLSGVSEIITGSTEIITGSLDETTDEFSETIGEGGDGEIFISYGDIYITEIQPYDTNNYGEYIKISAKKSYSGKIVISGVGRGVGEKVIEITIIAGSSLLLIDAIGNIPVDEPYILVDSLTLTNGGETLEIYDDKNNLLDSVVYTSSSTLLPVFFTTLQGNQRLFSSIQQESGSSEQETTEEQEGQEEYIEDNISSEEDSQELVFSDFSISEIYPFDTEQFSEYIEIFFHSDYMGNILFEGAGQGITIKTITVEAMAGERIILTDGPGNFVEGTKILTIDSISLSNTGEEIKVYRQDGQQIDSLVYTDISQGKSVYFSLFSGDIRLFSEVKLPTPGISEDHLLYLFPSLDKTDSNLPVCGIHYQNKTPFLLHNKINLIATVDGKEIQNSSTTYSCKRESIGGLFDITVCNPSFFSFTYSGIYPLGVTIYNEGKALCSIQTDINYPDTPLVKKQILSGDTSLVENEGTISYEIGSGDLVLIGVLANPGGSDTDHEKIILKNNGDTSLDLSIYSLYNGKTKKKLPNYILNAHEQITLSGTWGLVNKPTCISLWDGIIYANPFCYPQALDDQWFYESLPILFSTKQEYLDTQALLSSLSLVLQDNKTCLIYAGVEIICKSLPFLHDDILKRKALAKKYDSLAKKLLLAEERIDLRREKYHAQVAKRKDESSLANKKLQTEKLKSSYIQQESRLHESFIRLLIHDLQYNWGTLFYNSDLIVYYNTYNELKRIADTGQYSLSFVGFTLNIEDLEEYILLTSSEHIPLSTNNLTDVYGPLISTTQESIATFIKNLKQR